MTHNRPPLATNVCRRLAIRCSFFHRVEPIAVNLFSRQEYNNIMALELL